MTLKHITQKLNTRQAHNTFAVIILVALVFVLYKDSLSYGFTNLDDTYLITENPHIRGISPETLRGIFTEFDPELYTPLTFLTVHPPHSTIHRQIVAF